MAKQKDTSRLQVEAAGAGDIGITSNDVALLNLFARSPHPKLLATKWSEFSTPLMQETAFVLVEGNASLLPPNVTCHPREAAIKLAKNVIDLKLDGEEADLRKQEIDSLALRLKNSVAPNGKHQVEVGKSRSKGSRTV